MNIRVEFENDATTNQKDIVPTLMISVMELLVAWKADGSIDGIYDHSDSLQQEDFQDVDRWLDTPKVIVKKKNIYAELYVQLHTKYSTFQLYKRQKQLCDQQLLKLETKKTKREHTKKFRFIVRSYVQLASIDNYTK